MKQGRAGQGDLLERRQRVLGKMSPLFYQPPIQLVRGEDVWVFDERGRRYLDAYNNVPHVGHCHPRILEAMARQASTLNTHTRYLHEGIVRYAERLVATFHPSLDTAVFTCSGSEANDLALRMIRAASGGLGVICSAHAYHGNTTGVLPVSTLFTPPAERGPYVRTVPVIDPYRDRAGRQDPQLAEDYAREIERSIESFREANIPFAGLLFCSTFSGEGLPDVPPAYLARVLELVHRAGGYVISDEVQSGFGRYGTHMWGHQRLGAVADIATLGKPMGNGYPMAAVIARRELLEKFNARRGYFNTFAGNPVVASVGMALLDVLEEQDLLANARQVGDYTRDRIRELAARHDLIGNIRGGGLFIAVDLVTDRTTKQPASETAERVVNEMRNAGVLINRIGVGHNVLKIRPPMTFKAEHADLLVSTLEAALAAL